MHEVKTAKLFLKKNYQNLGFIKLIKNLSYGPNSESYFFHTKNGKYVLRYIKDHPSPSKIAQTYKILKYLQTKSLPVQDIIMSDYGKFYDSKNSIYVTKFYEGTFSKGTLNEIKDLAINVAYLHKFLYQTKIKFDFEHDTDSSFQILSIFDIKHIRKIIEQRKNKSYFDKKILKNLELLKQIICEQNKKNKLKSNSFQLIHNDLTVSNVIFHKNKVKVVLDFDGMKKGNILEEIAFTSLRFSTINNFKKSDVEKKINFFLKHYLNHNSVDEKNFLYLQIYSVNNLLSKLSYILKKNYFYDDQSWINDFDYFFKLLKCSYRISWPN
jgi:Ser/Thr protein kinase RdoA (MazF antagonist)